MITPFELGVLCVIAWVVFAAVIFFAIVQVTRNAPEFLFQVSLGVALVVLVYTCGLAYYAALPVFAR